MIRDCERLRRQKGPMKNRSDGTGQMPYLT